MIDGRLSRHLWIALAAVAVAMVGLNSFIQYPRGLIQDDAFFYSQIAYNLGLHHFSSFDGVHVTSGYHLLWAFLLAAVAKLVSFFSIDKDVHLLAMTSVYLFLGLIMADRFGKFAWEKVVLFLTCFLATVLMETLLLSIGILIIASIIIEGKRLGIWSMAVFFLLPLIRIDSVLIGGILALAFWHDKRSLFKAFVALLLGAIVHFALMHAMFGQYLSVSSMTKFYSRLSTLDRIRVNTLRDGAFRPLSFLLLVLPLFVAILKSHPEKKGPRLFIFASVVFFICFHAVFNANVKPWYFLPLYLGFAYLAFSLENAFWRRTYLVAHSVLLLFYFSYKATTVVQYQVDGTFSKMRAFAADVGRQVGPNGRVYMIDSSGFMGYFSQSHIINGDGLVNDYQYAARLKNSDLKNYLVENKIDYVITNEAPPSPDYLIDFRGLRVPTSSVQEVLSSRVTCDPGICDMKLYRIE